ncbi:hypothetical protein J7T55_007890 [Diaporthe amygdali]|uniref:uncharacterized protein n=1 Tax=Phomopsis amygdali TaxID=1214568 RepID=UPI0022FE75D2|nr:uncharacterized protein J7T55_007890 [Diaporthe amygdali]KAJ0114056.1 hypothetical protein J7T55_007890 [Diaporthe amygdali]
MAMGGQGPMAVLVMWIMVVPTFVCVVLRFYTRVFVIQSHGADDHVYNFAFICLLCYTIFVTIAANYGFGQSASDLLPSDLANAILFEAIGQTFAVIGMAVAKWSLGLFLLRIIHLRVHKVLIWIVMALLMGASVSTCFVFWLQCTPPAYLWDRSIPGGICQVDSTPVSMLLCILCVLADFFFAISPWFFIWNLQMGRREKMVTLISLSLGVIAGAFGIKRTIDVPQLSSPNYTRDTVGLIIWSAAEIAVTMICIAVPVCRPLYNRFLDKFTSQGTGSYQRQNGSGQSPGFALHTFGGSTLKPRGGQGHRVSSKRRTSPGEADSELPSFGGHKMGYTSTYATAMGVRQENNQSEEEILGPEARKGGLGLLSGPGSNAIRVTEEVDVTSSTYAEGK